ncbi:MAG: glycoside hydrolase family 6 protein [bacterium]
MPIASRAPAYPTRLRIASTLLVLSAACSADSAGIMSPTITTTDSTASNPPVTQAPGATGSASAPNVMAGAIFWADPSSSARSTADAWRITRPADAAQMDKIASQGTARWIGNWNADVRADVNAAVSTITGAGAFPVLVAYNIPQRDCGGFSGSNNISVQGYRDWITAFANGIGARRAAVILEPDALAGMDCLSAPDQQVRTDLLRYAVQTLVAKGSVSVYLDAGNPRWKTAATMAQRLVSAGIAQAQGFSLNVSNFYLTSENTAYGAQVSGLVGGKHFVIDTGRNGLGPATDAAWCNPDGRAIGARPTTATGNALVDAYLWIKTPGESDGTCNGAPAAGTWMPEYALGLSQRG